MANNKRIEDLAINILERELYKSDYLKSYIDSNDKTPSWDGNVIVYTNSEGKKSDIYGKVPVQVKGTEVNPVNKDGTITFSAEVSDLQNYYRDGGVVFFVVYVQIPMLCGEIYYSSLLPYDLNSIVKLSKSQKTYSIQLKPFPVDSESEITNVFMDFCSNRPKQMCIIGKDLPSLESLKNSGAIIESISFGATGIGINRNNIESYIVSHDIYLYAKTKGNDIDIPVEKITSSIISRGIDAPIKVKEEVFYQTYNVVFEKGLSYILIGNCFTLNIDDENKTSTDNDNKAINIKMKGKLDERIRDLKFIIALIDEQEVTINGATIKVKPVSEEKISQFRETLNYWEDVKRMLDILGVREELNCDLLKQNDYINLNNFIDTVLYNHEIKFPNINDRIHYGFFAIANLKILLWYDIQPSGNYKIQSFFNSRKNAIYEYNKKKIEISQYLILQNCDFSYISNLDYESILEDFKSKPIIDDTAELINFFVLNLISSYDKQEKKDDGLLKLAYDICNLLEGNITSFPQDNIILNKLQIIKRKRALIIDETVVLASLKEDNKSLPIRCGAYILLEEFGKAKECLNKMKSDEEVEFKKCPIYNLYIEKGE